MLSVTGFFILITYLRVCSSDLVENKDKLIAVTVLYRHGARTIVKSYPNDPYRDPSNWPVPFGELTNVGKQNHYLLGKWLRERYNSFLSSKYLAQEFHIESSSYDRCLMSAASNLAGLYPPKGDQVWNEELLWQPIPIHTIPTTSDGLLALDKPCPNYYKLLKEIKQGDHYQAIKKDNEKLFAYLTEKTGYKINDASDGYEIYDTLLVESFFNYTLPEWTESVFPDKLRKLALATFEIETFTPEVAKYRVGQFFHKVLDQFDGFIANDTSVPKFKVYSGHDTNVFNALNSLKILNFGLVPYCGMIMLELKQTNDGKYFVNLSYKHGDDVELLTIKGCTTNCDYDQFKSILEPLSVCNKDWEELCNS